MMNPPANVTAVQTTTTLAEHLGLSRWTVSRVLNGHTGVSKRTVKRVHDAMAELNFQPNSLARGLRGGRTHSVGICFQELDSPILSHKASILQQLLRDKQYYTLLELTNRNSVLERQVIRHFLSVKVDAVVLIGSSLAAGDAALESLADQDVPTIFVDPALKPAGPAVEIDRAHSMELALDHLFGLGHRRFAILGIDPTVDYGAARLAGWKAAAKRRSLDPEGAAVELFEPGNALHNYDMGFRLAEQFLDIPSDQRPSAILAINDRVAIGAVNCLRQSGLRVPDDVSVVGYDNLDVTDYTLPPLTTIDQQATELMRTAFDMLMQSIGEQEGRLPKRPVRIPPRLVVRASTAPPPRLNR